MEYPTQGPSAIVDVSRCEGCGVCTDLCPIEAIKICDGVAVVGEDCLGCGVCVPTCPSGAISIQTRQGGN
ncbi:MAG TPA: 4Fe-4S binding protein [bacterium]|nr:4Fe-4S binding protein [bacterium]HQO34204.1 4Fe-4S binding protein [bacterium]HQP99499.1 4Fe-4S binding protein [bacterium]